MIASALSHRDDRLHADLASNQALPALDTSHATCCYWRRLLGKARAWLLLKYLASWLADSTMFPDSWGFPMASAVSQAYTVHRRNLAYKEQMSFRLRNSNSRSNGKDNPHRLRRFGEWKKHARPLDIAMRFGAVHSRGADVLFLILLWVEKNCFRNWSAHGDQTAAEDPSEKCGAQTSKSGSRTSRWKVYFS